MRSTNTLITAALVVLAGASGACSSPTAPQTFIFYSAAVNVDEEDTQVELLKLVADEDGNVTSETLDGIALGYSALPFLTGRGTVPVDLSLIHI